MAKPDIRLEVSGLIEAENKALQIAEDLEGPRFREGMQKSVMMVVRDAKLLAPVDMGGIKNSITGTVTAEKGSVQGVVGSKLHYAPFMELGAKPHWPPISALEVWARRHGIDPFLVARAISKRGLKPRKFLEGSFLKNRSTIETLLDSTVGSIIEKKG